MSKKANSQKKIRKPKVHTLDVEVTEEMMKAPKNTRGELGEICNYCGGFGFTLTPVGESKSAGCPRCFGSGIEPVDTHELQKQVKSIAASLVGLKKLIINLSKEKLKDE